MSAIPDRSQRVNGYFRRIIVGKLTRIELRDDSIESPGMNDFELRGVDAPLIHCHLQSVEDGSQSRAASTIFCGRVLNPGHDRHAGDQQHRDRQDRQFFTQ